MDTLPLIAVIAAVWHVSLALIERSRYPKQAKPPLGKLLLLAEVEVLRTLRAELRRHLVIKREPVSEQKLDEVEKRLKEMGEGAG